MRESKAHGWRRPISMCGHSSTRCMSIALSILSVDGQGQWPEAQCLFSVEASQPHIMSKRNLSERLGTYQAQLPSPPVRAASQAESVELGQNANSSLGLKVRCRSSRTHW